MTVVMSMPCGEEIDSNDKVEEAPHSGKAARNSEVVGAVSDPAGEDNTNDMHGTHGAKREGGRGLVQSAVSGARRHHRETRRV